MKLRVIQICITIFIVSLVSTIPISYVAMKKGIKGITVLGLYPSSECDVRFFSDSSLTNQITSIDWGTVVAGGSVSRIVWMKNFGNGMMPARGEDALITHFESNFNPSAISKYLSLKWDYANYRVVVGTIYTVTFILSCSIDIINENPPITTFSFDTELRNYPYRNVDINQDRVCNMKDVATAVYKFNTTDQACDVDNSGRVNMKDIAILIQCFNKPV